jgi:hypothetical protein
VVTGAVIATELGVGLGEAVVAPLEPGLAPPPPATPAATAEVQLELGLEHWSLYKYSDPKTRKRHS